MAAFTYDLLLELMESLKDFSDHQGKKPKKPGNSGGHGKYNCYFVWCVCFMLFFFHPLGVFLSNLSHVFLFQMGWFTQPVLFGVCFC